MDDSACIIRSPIHEYVYNDCSQNGEVRKGHHHTSTTPLHSTDTLAQPSAMPTHTFTSSLRPLLISILPLLSRISSAAYVLQTDYSGVDFFDGFNFVSGP